ncbi:response regulator transcription factor [Paenibacillus sp. GCM10027626]|uniref:response regulator transcription factor n=1 Tax=Paenibacillus sp. GCM10027626 TaxID=3273411 RepID=UPI003629CF5B
MDRQAGRLLIVDDEERIRKLLRMYLEKEGFRIEEASDGKTALQKALLSNYDLIVLDRMLPGMNGIEICSRLRREKQTPVLMLTAQGDELGKLEGFRAGADDYVVKPFSPREVVCRVKAIVNRSGQQPIWTNARRKESDLILPHVTINTAAHRVEVNGYEVRLTLKEYDLLHFLGTNEGIAFTREELLKEVWDYDYIHSGDVRTVDTHVKRIREKLNRISTEAGKLIRTIWGIGYCLRR